MTVVEFLHKKNKIIFDITGVTLIPESQIQECEQFPLGIKDDAACCPYCVVFFDESTMSSDGCDGRCPIKNADNCCFHFGSTYRDVRNKIPDFHKLQDIKNLVAEYNDGL